MKTVTAKEFQFNQSQMMKEVAKGTVYQVTYHGKPWVELHPVSKPALNTRAGSPEAFRESLDITLSSTQLPTKPDYKAIRKQYLSKKYAE
jgi:antitoxin (DNA-binding transcriptional repressor) of toxin-antitoxin stability system